MENIALREFLQKKYENPEAFLQNVIYPVFGEENYDSSGNYHWLRRHPEDQTAADNAGILDILVLGSIYVEGSQLDIFDVTVASKHQLANNRVGIQQLIRRIISTHSGAFIVFHYKTSDRWDWRFTFCHKGASQLDSSDAKRYTFLLGPGQSCRTAALNFDKLRETIATTGSFTMNDVIKAFDVEALSIEFFGKYKAQYEKFVAYMADPRNGMREDFIDTDFEHDGLSEEDIISREEKPLRDYVKKLLGRIVFLYFIQKKGWLGVKPDKDWGDGDTDFMLHLFEMASDEQKANFLDEVLEPLFEGGLNTDRSGNNYLFDTGIKALPNGGVLKVPYLNGGLFERDASDEPESVFPADYFGSLLEFLSQYNFTIDENDPNDAQVGIDPEMLGRIFENLLEDNKDRGTFYTPKEVVQYMCRESLIAFLQSDKNDDEVELIRDFVLTYDVDKLPNILRQEIDQKLKAVRICDPAIGSGAFPMGLLKEIFYCRGALENFEQAALIKKQIINNNIYGVDIEQGAIDIARLRFWLAIVVDEDNPTALPNLDYKIMQGDSLQESYDNTDLSHLMDEERFADGSRQGSFFDDIIEDTMEELSVLQKSYFNCSDHKEKKSIEKDIKTVINTQLSARHIKINLDNIENIAANQEFFLWHTWFADIFSNGGFDIIIGNPPYNGISQNNGDSIKRLIEDYKKEPGTNLSLKERKLWLQDDYVKFIRKMEDFIESSPKGILAFINNSSFIDNPTFRGMRWHLLNSFDTITILDLHGNSRKSNVSELGVKDENVFNIMQGVSINIFEKKYHHKDNQLAEVFHAEIIGTRKHKQEMLSTKYTELSFQKVAPVSPFYFLVPQNRQGIDEYETGFSIPSLMPLCVTGVVTARDGLVIDIDRDTLYQKIEFFADLTKTDAEVRNHFFGGKKSTKYLPGDSRGWRLTEARQAIQSHDIDSTIIPLAFRVLDNRYIYYSPDMVDWGREEVYNKHILNKDNYCLVVPRQTTKEWKHVFVTDKVANFNFLATGGQNGAGTHFPLYLYDEMGKRYPNLNEAICTEVNRVIGYEASPEEVFDYTYGVLHSNKYRGAYMEFLKKDFPKIPFPRNAHAFKAIACVGRQLKMLHLFKEQPQNYEYALFKGSGDNVITKIQYRENRVYINKNQFFDNVPYNVWSFEIGDDQPALRWLKERKDFELSEEDIIYYQRVIYILGKTEIYMKRIDELDQ